MKNRKIKYLTISMMLITTNLATSCTNVVRRGLPPINVKEESASKFKYKIDKDRVKEIVNNISNEKVFRVQGSEEEKRVKEYIKKSFSDLGLEINEEAFNVSEGLIEELGFLKVMDVEIVKSTGVKYSPSTSKDGIKAELYDAGEGEDDNLKSDDIKGKIALIKVDKDKSINEKVEKLKEKGALAVLVSVKGSGDEIGLVVSEKDLALPVRIVSEKSATMFSNVRKNNKRFPVEYINIVKTHSFDSSNIMATLKAKKQTDENIILTAYTDSPSDPGAASNALGIASLIEIATLLKEKEIDKNLIFLVFSSAETDYAGVKHFIKTVPENIRKGNELILNLDSLGRSLDIGIYVQDPKGKDKSFVEKMMKDANVEKYVIKEYNFQLGKILAEAGFNSLGFDAEEDTLKNKTSDKPWTIDYNNYFVFMMKLMNILDTKLSN